MTQERSQKRIRSGTVKVRVATTLPNAPPLEALEVVDISMGGMGIKLPFPLAQDQEVLIELFHPILEGLLKLQARTAWCRMIPGDPYPNAGIEFVDTSDRQRMMLRLVQAAEVSCRVISAERTVGFVVTPGENHWALYDASTVKLATMTRIAGQFQVTFLGTRPEDSVHTFDAGSLPEAVAIALNIDDGTSLIVPPEGGNWIPITAAQQSNTPQPMTRPQGVGRLDRPITTERPVAMIDEPELEEPSPEHTQLPGSARFEHPNRAFHSVLAGGYHVGFVAVTSVDDVWSLYDEGWNETAVMSPFDGRYKVTFVSGSAGHGGASDSLDYIIAKTFLGGIAIAFDLKLEPELDPPLMLPEESSTDLDPSNRLVDVGPEDDDDEPEDPMPETESDDAPLPTGRKHHALIDREQGVIGYVSPTLGMEGAGVWSVYNAAREKVAMVAPDDNRFKVMFMGANPNDSIDYMVSRTLKGAFAITFDLERIPRLEPPMS